MILFGAAFGDDVDHAARVLSVLGVVIAGLNAELLDCVRHGEWSVHGGVFVDIVAAIEKIIGLTNSRAIGAWNRDNTDEREEASLTAICDFSQSRPKSRQP